MPPRSRPDIPRQLEQGLRFVDDLLELFLRPCAKRPGGLSRRYRRSARPLTSKSQDKLKQVIDETKPCSSCRRISGRIVAASDTGAVEAALWSLARPRPVDVFAWESFGRNG